MGTIDTTLTERLASRGGPPIPATCGGCGARVLQHTSPSVWVEERGEVHRCRTSRSRRVRLAEIRVDHAEGAIAAERRKRKPRRR